MRKTNIVRIGVEEPIRLRIPIFRWDYEKQIYRPLVGRSILVQVEKEDQIDDVHKRLEAALQ